MKYFTVITAILFLILNYIPVFCFDIQIEKGLKEKLKFTNSQIQSIKKIYYQAQKEKVPDKIMDERIYEAIAKNVSYEIFYKVFNEKVNRFIKAKHLIKNANSSPDYYIKLLAELMERGLTEDDFNEISAIASLANKNFKDTLLYVKTYVILTEQGLSNNLAKEITVYSMKLRSSEVKFVPELFSKAKEKNVSLKKVRDIFIKGINNKKNYLWIYRNLYGKEPEEIKKEIIEEIKRDYEHRK